MTSTPASDTTSQEQEPRPRRRRRPISKAVQEAAERLGIEQLYPEQEQVLTDLLSGRDVMMILPTGFGKSACYQIPSMVMPKPVVVISPLLALLRDQHEKLTKRDIPVVRIDGTVRGRARREALERLAEGGSLLVMTTPETLAVPEVRAALTKSGVSLVAVDEAHCLSEWGHDFRPAYMQLGRRLQQLGSPPVLALTATATPRVREKIEKALGMRDPEHVSSSPHRSNLAFEVIPCEGDLRPRVLIRLAKRLRRPGIVYCATKREVDALYVLLRRFKIPAHRYHGGMTATERNKEQARFMKRGRREVMIATSAFGLGIDKPDIRYILHYQAPASLEQYVQEAGRGGRDGKKSNCIMLDDPSDRAIHEALLIRSRVRPEKIYPLGQALAAWGGEKKQPTMSALALSAELGPRVTAALLHKLEEADLVHVHDDGVELVVPHDEIEERAAALAGHFETLRTQDGHRLDAMQKYARSDDCRAVFLREYFGEESGEVCDLCDLCRDRPARPSRFFAPLVVPTPPSRRKKKARRGGSRSRKSGGRSGERSGERSAARDGESSGRKKGARKSTRRRGGRGRRGGRRRRRGGSADSESPPPTED